jgi:C4-dicarboxylate transporter DctM subunit
MLLETLLIFAGAVLLMVLRVPVAFAFSVAAIGLSLVAGVSISWGVQQSFGLLLSFGFLALPLYLFLGAAVAESGMAERLANFFSSLVGRVRGGLGASVILTNAVFGAISGSALAALSGLGRAFLDPMERRGYPRPYTTALLIPSSTLSQMIPPSGHMIVYGFMAQLPISLCFVAPVIPGLILVAFMLMVHFVLVRKIPSVQKEARVDLKSDVKQVASTGKKAFFPLLIPIGILGGIYGGIWTPTEAAGAGVVYVLLLWYTEL